MKYLRRLALILLMTTFVVTLAISQSFLFAANSLAESDAADSSSHGKTPSSDHGSPSLKQETPESDSSATDIPKDTTDQADGDEEKAEGAEQKEEEEEKKEEERTDAILLLDASGSMRITDPTRLRDEGADLFAQFLGEEDYLAIVEFAEEARTIRPLTQFKRDGRREIIEQIARVGNSGLYTDLLAGIKQAHDILKNEGRPDANKVVVLLSDGKMDPDPKKGTATRLTDYMIHDYLPELKREGIKIHTLAFSNQVDRDLLSSIAESTEGVDWFTQTVDDIHESFAELFLVVKKPQMVPLSGKGFLIDENVREATFYINNSDTQGEVKIVTPDGFNLTRETKKANVNWYGGEKFDVVTITEPSPGDWEVVGLPKGEGFATVLTNLKLITEWSNSVIAASPATVEARLFEDDKPIVLPQMANESKFLFQVTPTDKVSEPIIKELLVDDGEHGDRQPGDGVFSRLVTIEEPGEYQLRVLARGPTFERQQIVPFRVKERLVTLEVVAVERSTSLADGEHGHGEGEKHAGAATSEYFRVKLSSEVATLKKVSIELLAVNEAGKKYQLPLQQSKDVSLYYEVPAAALPKDQKYQLQAFVSGRSKRKEEVSGSSQVLGYDRSAHEIDESQEDVSMIVVAEDEIPEEEGPPSPLPYLLSVTLVNGGVGALCFVLLQKSQSQISITIPQYEPPAELLEAVSGLEAKAAETEVNPDDPIFEQDSVPLPSGEALEGAEAPSEGTEGAGEDSGETEGGEAQAGEAEGEEEASEDVKESSGDAEADGEEEALAEDEEAEEASDESEDEKAES